MENSGPCKCDLEGAGRSAPLVKWPGGKRGLLRALLPLVPSDYRRYYEPFLGGGALFFALRPDRSILGDRNCELISMYREVRDNPDRVIASLRRLKNTEKEYYRVRASRPIAGAARAARLLYLMTLAFNGIHRVNLRGEFNVPYGFKTHLDPCEEPKIRQASIALANTRLVNEDFERTVASAAAGDVVYLDPPYTTSHRNNGFVKYNAKIFTWNDQRRLAALAERLVKRGCSVIVSNADHESIDELYRGFDKVRVPRHSVIAASAHFRRGVSECVFYRVGI